MEAIIAMENGGQRIVDASDRMNGGPHRNEGQRPFGPLMCWDVFLSHLLPSFNGLNL